MARGKAGTGATTARARSGTTNRQSGGLQFMPLFTVGPYAAFWVGNQLDILKMTGGALLSIRNEASCTDVWDVLTLYLKDHNVIPAARAQASAAGVGRKRTAVAPITDGKNDNSGTIRRTRARRQPPINSTAVGAGSVNSNT